jgi:DNA-binding NarL/FixJ family response regulator
MSLTVEKNVKVFIAGENRMSCQLMAAALRRSGFPFTIVDCAVDSRGIRASLDVNEIDVAVICAHLKDGNDAGFNVTREVLAAHSKTDVIMLLDSNDQEAVVEAFQAGATGVISRDESFEVLCKCIHAVSQGQVWASSQELRFLVQALIRSRPMHTASTKSGKPSHSLTPREEGVVHLVAEGLTNRDISQHLNLSEHTVRNYLFRIYNKLGTSNRLELALYEIHRRKGDQEQHQ